ncbi:MAG: UPF0489 family protein, partial [Candidatus Omnitrophica bacterium]|nr:UPF0489 family protein [Candidatus Omnitrophota bacterium]
MIRDKSVKSDTIISIMSYKHSMLCKIVACLLIMCFTINSTVYGADREDFRHASNLRAVRSIEAQCPIVSTNIAGLQAIVADGIAPAENLLRLSNAPAVLFPSGRFLVTESIKNDPAAFSSAQESAILLGDVLRRLISEGKWPNEVFKITAEPQPTQESDLDAKPEAKQPEGTPGVLLRYMHENEIYSYNPRKPGVMAEERGVSYSTINRERKILEAVGLIEGDERKGYYLTEWLRGVNIDKAISEDPVLRQLEEKASLSDKERKKIKARVRRLKEETTQSTSEVGEGEALVTKRAEGAAAKKDKRPQSTVQLLKKAKRVLQTISDFKHDANNKLANFYFVTDGYLNELLQDFEMLINAMDRFNLKGDTEIETEEQARDILFLSNYFVDRLNEWNRKNDADKIFSTLSISKHKHEYAQGIRRQIVAIKRMIEDLTNIVRRVPAPIRKDKINLKKLITEELQAVVMLSEHSKKASFPKRLPHILGDEVPLRRAFSNIFRNAREAMTRKRKPLLAVSARLTEEKDFVEIEISDNGPGIPKNILPHIFKRLFTTKKKSGGTGLGLAIVTEAIECHNGTIEVRSRVGKGTTFTIRLPVAKPPAADVSKKTDKSKSPEGTPANLLRHMHENEIYSDNPRKPGIMAQERGLSYSTINSERKILEAIGLIERDGTEGYYLPEWLRGVDIDKAIPILRLLDGKASLSEDEKKEVIAIVERAKNNSLRSIARDFRAFFQLKSIPQSPLSFIMSNHGRAYNAWTLSRLKKRVRKGAVLVHFDWHEDASEYPYGGYPKTPEDALKRDYASSHFIAPAALEGTIDETVFVIPHGSSITLGDEELTVGDYMFYAVKQRVRIRKVPTCRIITEKEYGEEKHKILSGRKIKVRVVSDVDGLRAYEDDERDIICDIDFDFIHVTSSGETRYKNATTPDETREVIRGEVSKLREYLIKIRKKTKVVTMALSPETTPYESMFYIWRELQETLAELGIEFARDEFGQPRLRKVTPKSAAIIGDGPLGATPQHKSSAGMQSKSGSGVSPTGPSPSVKVSQVSDPHADAQTPPSKPLTFFQTAPIVVEVHENQRQKRRKGRSRPIAGATVADMDWLKPRDIYLANDPKKGGEHVLESGKEVVPGLEGYVHYSYGGNLNKKWLKDAFSVEAHPSLILTGGFLWECLLTVFEDIIHCVKARHRSDRDFTLDIHFCRDLIFPRLSERGWNKISKSVNTYFSAVLSKSNLDFEIYLNGELVKPASSAKPVVRLFLWPSHQYLRDEILKVNPNADFVKTPEATPRADQISDPHAETMGWLIRQFRTYYIKREVAEEVTLEIVRELIAIEREGGEYDLKKRKRTDIILNVATKLGMIATAIDRMVNEAAGKIRKTMQEQAQLARQAQLTLGFEEGQKQPEEVKGEEDDMDEAEKELKPIFIKVVSDLMLWLCGAEVETIDNFGEWRISAYVMAESEEFLSKETTEKINVLMEMLEERVSDKFKNFESSVPFSPYQRARGFHIPESYFHYDTFKMLIDDVFRWVLDSNHPVLDHVVDGMSVREIIEYFHRPFEGKVHELDSLLEPINKNQSEEVITETIEKIKRCLKALELRCNVHLQYALSANYYRERLEKAMLALPGKAKERADSLLEEERKKIKQAIKDEEEGLINVLGLLGLNKSLAAETGVLPYEVESALSKDEINSFYSRRKRLRELINLRLNERMELARAGRMRELGEKILSREAFECLTEYTLPTARAAAEEAIESGNLCGFIAKRNVIAHPSLGKWLRQREKARYNELMEPILEDLDERAGIAFAGHEVIGEIIDGVHNPEKVFMVEVVKVGRVGKDVKYLEVEYRGIKGRVESEELPISVHPGTTEGKEFPALLIDCEWEGIIPKPKFSIRRAEEMVLEELREAYRSGKRVPVVVIDIGRFADGGPSGFKLAYKGIEVGFIYKRETGVYFDRLSEKELQNNVGMQFNAKVISLEEERGLGVLGHIKFSFLSDREIAGRRPPTEVERPSEREEPLASRLTLGKKAPPRKKGPSKAQRRAERSAAKAKDKADEASKMVEEMRRRWAAQAEEAKKKKEEEGMKKKQESTDSEDGGEGQKPEGLSAAVPFAGLAAPTLLGKVFILFLTYFYLCTQREAIIGWLHNKSYLRLERLARKLLLDPSKYRITRYLAKSLSYAPGLSIRSDDSGQIVDISAKVPKVRKRFRQLGPSERGEKLTDRLLKAPTIRERREAVQSIVSEGILYDGPEVLAGLEKAMHKDSSLELREEIREALKTQRDELVEYICDPKELERMHTLEMLSLWPMVDLLTEGMNAIFSTVDLKRLWRYAGQVLKLIATSDRLECAQRMDRDIHKVVKVSSLPSHKKTFNRAYEVHRIETNFLQRHRMYLTISRFDIQGLSDEVDFSNPGPVADLVKNAKREREGFKYNIAPEFYLYVQGPATLRRYFLESIAEAFCQYLSAPEDIDSQAAYSNLMANVAGHMSLIERRRPKERRVKRRRRERRGPTTIEGRYQAIAKGDLTALGEELDETAGALTGIQVIVDDSNALRSQVFEINRQLATERLRLEHLISLLRKGLEGKGPHLKGGIVLVGAGAISPWAGLAILGLMLINDIIYEVTHDERYYQALLRKHPWLAKVFIFLRNKGLVYCQYFLPHLKDLRDFISAHISPEVILAPIAVMPGVGTLPIFNIVFRKHRPEDGRKSPGSRKYRKYVKGKGKDKRPKGGPSTRADLEISKLCQEAKGLEPAERLRPLLQAYDLNKRDLVVLNELAMAYRKLEKLQEAEDKVRASIKQARRLLSKNQRREFATRNLGMAYGLLAGILVAQNRLDEACQALHQEIRYDRNNFIAYTYLSSVQLDLGRLDEAYQSIMVAIELKPDDIVARSHLFNILRARGDLDGARAVAEEQIKLWPERADGYINLSFILFNFGQLEEACEYAKRATELEPDSPVKHGNLCHILLALGRLHEARAAACKSIELDPDNPISYGHLCRVLLALGELEKARTAAEKYIKLAPDDPIGYGHFCNVLLALGKLDEACKAAGDHVKLNPNNPIGYIHLSEALLALGELEEALEATRKVIELEPDNPIGYMQESIVLHALGLRISILQGEEKARGFCRKNEEVTDYLADSYSPSFIHWLKGVIDTEEIPYPRGIPDGSKRHIIAEHLLTPESLPKRGTYTTFFPPGFTESNADRWLEAGLKNLSSIRDLPDGTKLDWWPKHILAAYFKSAEPEGLVRMTFLLDRRGNIVTAYPDFGPGVTHYKGMIPMSTESHRLVPHNLPIWNKDSRQPINVLVGNSERGFKAIFNSPLLSELEFIEREQLIWLAATEGEPYQDDHYFYYKYTPDSATWRDAPTVFLKVSKESFRTLDILESIPDRARPYRPQEHLKGGFALAGLGVSTISPWAPLAILTLMLINDIIYEITYNDKYYQSLLNSHPWLARVCKYLTDKGLVYQRYHKYFPKFISKHIHTFILSIIDILTRTKIKFQSPIVYPVTPEGMVGPPVYQSPIIVMMADKEPTGEGEPEAAEIKALRIVAEQHKEKINFGDPLLTIEEAYLYAKAMLDLARVYLDSGDRANAFWCAEEVLHFPIPWSDFPQQRVFPFVKLAKILIEQGDEVIYEEALPERQRQLRLCVANAHCDLGKRRLKEILELEKRKRNPYAEELSGMRMEAMEHIVITQKGFEDYVAQCASSDISDDRYERRGFKDSLHGLVYIFGLLAENSLYHGDYEKAKEYWSRIESTLRIGRNVGVERLWRPLESVKKYIEIGFERSLLFEKNEGDKIYEFRQLIEESLIAVEIEEEAGKEEVVSTRPAEPVRPEGIYVTPTPIDPRRRAIVNRMKYGHPELILPFFIRKDGALKLYNAKTHSGAYVNIRIRVFIDEALTKDGRGIVITDKIFNDGCEGIVVWAIDDGREREFPIVSYKISRNGKFFREPKRVGLDLEEFEGKINFAVKDLEV